MLLSLIMLMCLNRHNIFYIILTLCKLTLSLNMGVQDVVFVVGKKLLVLKVYFYHLFYKIGLVMTASWV